MLRERFIEGCRRATPEEQTAFIKILGELRAALHDPQRRAGIGLRKLHPTRLWEVRIGLNLRALFRQEGEDAIFMLLGTHDEVQRFLRNCAD